MATRYDGRAPDELRPFSFTRDFTTMTMGSCLVSFGETRVLCTASVEDDVPRWMKGKGEGWVTAEYAMLPGSSPERIGRERRGAKGRTQEIERLIGRSLRAVTDMRALGETSIRLDCDVLQADGGTRTASICGATLPCTMRVNASCRPVRSRPTRWSRNVSPSRWASSPGSRYSTSRIPRTRPPTSTSM